MSGSFGKSPMPLKYWSFAGIILSYWCNARCASCYLRCSSARTERMDAACALEIWRQLIDACPRGCRVHLTGGEPFGDWDLLIELCRLARDRGLGPLEKVETNAFWATDERIAHERLAALDQAGMGALTISADPYHQQYVPIERCRLLARVAAEVLGDARVQVRWRDWLLEGFNTNEMSEAGRQELFARYAASGRDRMSGRAADGLATRLPLKPPADFTDMPCRQCLLRGRHVHVDAAGRVMPGTCAGIVLGQVTEARPVKAIWEELSDGSAGRPILAALAEQGPWGLMPGATAAGFVSREGYASKCHFCWDLRRHLALRGLGGEELGPDWLYQAERDE